jgi:membrane fusion protein
MRRLLPEAIAFQQRGRQWGQVSVLQPVPTGIVTWFLTISALMMLLFLSFGHYARKETVLGYLTPRAGTAKIFVPQSGTIREVHVREGDEVRPGQSLLTIATDQVADNDKDVNATMLDSLASQKNSLSRQIAAEAERTKSERTRLTAVSGGLQTEIAELEAQIKLQGERVKLSGDFVEAARQLRAKGDVADLELKKREMALLDLRQSLSALNQQLVTRQNQLTDTRTSLAQLPAVSEQAIQKLRNEVAATDQRIAEVHGRRAYVIHAPTAGRVSTLQATVGQFADPRRLQLEIVPPDGTLTAELFVPARAIGFVKSGQTVRILYDAFPYQNFGTQGGRVTNISRTALTGTDAGGPVALGEPAYKVTAALDRQDIDAYGRRVPLQPDMLLRADIILERRALASWILEPLLSVRM